MPIQLQKATKSMDIMMTVAGSLGLAEAGLEDQGNAETSS
jgi:hypothetical protein